MTAPTGEMPNPPAPEGETPPEQQQPTTADLLAELNKTRTALKAANSESAERRKRLEALEQAEQERKTAEMTDLQKAQADAAAAQKRADDAEQATAAALARATETALRSAVTTEAMTQGVDDAELPSVWREFSSTDALRKKVKVDDDGNVDGVTDAVKEIVKAHPRWLKTQTRQGDINATRRGTRDATAETEEIARRKRASYSGF